MWMRMWEVDEQIQLKPSERAPMRLNVHLVYYTICPPYAINSILIIIIIIRSYRYMYSYVSLDGESARKACAAFGTLQRIDYQIHLNHNKMWREICWSAGSQSSLRDIYRRRLALARFTQISCRLLGTCSEHTRCNHKFIYPFVTLLACGYFRLLLYLIASTLI